MNGTDFIVTAIDPEVADQLRRRGGPVYVADEHPGYPCRQCLRDADVGEELILVSHDPFTGESPYRSAGPIFIHRQRCTPLRAAPRPASAELPQQLTRRQLSVRAFDEAEMMVDAAVIDGTHLSTTIHRLLEDPGIHHLHVYNASRGCWAARIDRIAPATK